MNKTLWQSANGSIRTFSAMDNEHLANVIQHMRYYYGKVNEEVIAEAEYRGLSDEFLNGAPYPYKDCRIGEWKIWSYQKNRDVVISGKNFE
jgi:hypothetical protein